MTKIVKYLNEAAGISQEVRVWAKIIEDYVYDELHQPIDDVEDTTKIDDFDDEYGNQFYTHFVGEYGEKTDTAYVYGYDLKILKKLESEYPGLTEYVHNILFKIIIHPDGEIDIMPAERGDSVDDEIMVIIYDLVMDYASNDEPFHTKSFDYVYASTGDPEMDNHNPNTKLSQKWSDFLRTPLMRRVDKIEIDGTKYPEAYENFSVDKWVLTNSGGIEYDHWKSGYDEDGKYVVYLNMPISSIHGTMLVHEIKHSYDDWNRIKGGYRPIRDGWEIQNIYTKDFEKLVLGGGRINQILSSIIKLYYLGSKLESPAYLENEYDNSSFVKYRGVAKKLINFKSSDFIRKNGEAARGLQDSWSDILIEYDIPFFRKYPDVINFLKVTEKYFNKRGNIILKKIDKMNYVHKQK